jgi:hypothetical protein
MRPDQEGGEGAYFMTHLFTAPVTRHLYEHQNASIYYKKDHFDEFEDFIPEESKTRRTINLGCGLGLSCKWLFKNSIGIDFNRKLISAWQAHKVPALCLDVMKLPPLLEDDPQFLYSVSCDFLEHIPTNQIDYLLDNVLNVIAPRGFHVVDLTPVSGFRGPKQENLHCANWCEIQWRTAFQQRFPKAEISLWQKRFLIVSWIR